MVSKQTFLPIRYGLRTNQAKAGEHVTPRSNHTIMREIQRLCRYRTIQLRNLKELIGTIYINKMHLLVSSLSHKNSTFKNAWLGLVMRCETIWEVSQKMCE